jgi:hypothetical protein
MSAMKPWENEDGSTNVQAFLAAYEKDDNTFWRADMGHVMNVLDWLIDWRDRMIPAAEELLSAAEDVIPGSEP